MMMPVLLIVKSFFYFEFSKRRKPISAYNLGFKGNCIYQISKFESLQNVVIFHKADAPMGTEFMSWLATNSC